MDTDFQTSTIAPRDNLIAGELPRSTRNEVIAAGQDLKRGAVLGKITASGVFVLSAAAAGDGSQVPRAVLVHDVDATAGEKIAGVYRTGEFAEAHLILGAGHTIESIREQLADVGIFPRITVR